MNERTEEQKLFQDPIVVTLGGEPHTIKPLVIRDSRQWRQKLAALIGRLPSYMAITTDTPDEFAEGVSQMLVATPDAVADLFFEYAKELDREAIETVATEHELGKAFTQITRVAFPLVESLTSLMTTPSPSEPPSSPSSQHGDSLPNTS